MKLVLKSGKEIEITQYSERWSADGQFGFNTFTLGNGYTSPESLVPVFTNDELSSLKIIMDNNDEVVIGGGKLNSIETSIDHITGCRTIVNIAPLDA